MRLNCPVVSNDGFKNWMTDQRLDYKLRRWLQAKQSLWVPFTFNPQGHFTAVFELPPVGLKPKGMSPTWPCTSCQAWVGHSTGVWSAPWSDGQWTCLTCHDEWNRARSHW